MPLLNRIEETFAAWHKGSPHMPVKFRDGLVENFWRIVIVSAAICIYSLFALVPLIVTALVLTPSVNIITPNVTYDHDIPALGWAGLMATAIVNFITAIILVIAVYPVMEKQRSGWRLAYYAYLLNIMLGIVTLLMFPSIAELVLLLVVVFGGGYLLFEVRNQFSHVSRPRVKVKA